jgi:peptidoglycan hydrolase-like protein with peptidoglycan-binding domain
MKKFINFDAVPTLMALAMLFTMPVVALPVAVLGQSFTTTSSTSYSSSGSSSYGPFIPGVYIPVCTNLSYNLYYGAQDYFTGGQVSQLQNFLRSQGYYSGGVTGYFGSLTFSAVVRYQQLHGISATGYVGPLTRASISNVSCGTTPTSQSPVVSSLSPTSGAIGTTVTVTGSGFTNDNTVMFDSGAILHVSSSNGTTLTFNVPDSLTPACYYSTPRCLVATRMVTAGNYSVSIQNSNGTSNSLVFTVTGNSTNSPTISSLSPASGPVGATVTITGSRFTSDNTVHFNGGVVPHVVSSNGTTLTFTVPDHLNPACYYNNPPCMTFAAPPAVTPGNYSVSVENSFGTSNTLNFTVTGGGTTTGAPQISSIWPSSGPTGTVVTITGSGFTNDNNIKFDIGAITHVSSPNGTTLTFTVPNNVGPSCPYSQQNCVVALYLKQITAGNYNVSVENANGLSNAQIFTVTSNGGYPWPPYYNQPPVISGINGPTQLTVNQTGTWSIRANDPAYGQLSYSVTWGDENYYPYAMSSSAYMSPQQTSTFSHTYAQPGTYTIQFTVRNSSGGSAQSSMTVNVVNGWNWWGY